MKVLVTGGAGFIGSAVCRYLAAELGAEVLNLDKLSYAGSLSSLEKIADLPNYTFAHVDICDRVALDQAFDAFAPSHLIHLAAETHVDRSIGGSAAFVQSNVVGTHVLLEAARHYWSSLSIQAKSSFRFLHVSTDEVFGCAGDDQFFNECTAYDPRSPYSASKAAADHLVSAWHHTYGLPTIVTNCSNNYGPYQFPEKLIPLIILNALEMKALPIYGDGRHVRDWLYVEDHVRALIKCLSEGQVGATYLIGGRAPIQNIEVVNQICDRLDRLRPREIPRRELMTFVQDRPGHDRRYAIDPSKIEIDLGWRAEHSFEYGIESTILWYLENEKWWKKLRESVYGGERLGLDTPTAPN